MDNATKKLENAAAMDFGTALQRTLPEPSCMKDMALYDHVERIRNEILELGRDPEGPLEAELLWPFDQYHYDGIHAVDEVAHRLGLTVGERVLDVGSGIGGPARRLAAAHGLRVTALELQPDLHALAEALTRQCGLAHTIDHRLGDVLEGVPPPGSFDAIVSFLAILHIPQRSKLFACCRDSLAVGGRIGIEDFVALRSLDEAEAIALAVKVQCPYLPNSDEYRAQLKEAGFTSVEFEDMTTAWTVFTATRRDAFHAAREWNMRVHGSVLTDRLDDFYVTVAGLFASGAVGGIRVTARKK